QGSLWLTAFVLKVFAQARGLIFVDDGVLAAARDWIKKQQRPDGSFQPVGFIHHPELLGGLKGASALTAFVTIALRQAGDDAANAVRFGEGQVDKPSDPYAAALSTYALALAKSPRAGDARARLGSLAQSGQDGLTWSDRGAAAAAAPATAAIESTAYGAL